MESPARREQLRLGALREYNILDSAADPAFDDLAALASHVCQTPMAAVTLIDERRQWFKSNLGLGVPETPREIAFCAHTVNGQSPFVVEDALRDERFHSNPLVLGAPRIRFYAGTPLVSPQGHAVGALAVLDHVPRRLDESQMRALEALGRQVVHLLELRKQLGRLGRASVLQARSEQELQAAKAALESKVEQRSQALRREVEERIKERDASDALINSLPGVFYVFDRAGKLLRWNDNLMRITGRSAEEISGMSAFDFLAEGPDKALVLERVRGVFAGQSEPVECEFLARDGRRVPYFFNGVRVQIGDTVCLSGMGLDISARKRSELALREAEQRYRMLIELSPDAIFVMKDSQCVFANSAAVRLVGAASMGELLQPPFCRFIHPDSREQAAQHMRQMNGHPDYSPRVEVKFIQEDGAEIDAEVMAAGFSDHGEAASLVVARDVTQARQYQAQLEQHANYDPLTRLANRNLFHDRLHQAMADSDRRRVSTAVAFIDLDNFKLINDMLGHDVGDQLLVRVADRLKSSVRERDTVARYGGDEFMLVLNDCGDEVALSTWIGRLMSLMANPIRIGGHQLVATCSMGLSIYPRDGADPGTLLKHADAAMYQAKAAGRNQFKFFHTAMNERISERFTVEARLRQALERNELTLHYQPQIDLRSGEITGVEALLRWTCAKQGPISPAKFIPIAEDSGLIVPIGEWVLRQACQDNKLLQDAGVKPIAVSVNLSARQFYPRALEKSVRAALEESGLQPDWLNLEVTETTVMSRPQEAADILRDLKKIGVKLAIDDFGMGYSSLSYLQRFPMDQLKIDKSFIDHVADDVNDAAIAEAVISLGHSLKLEVLAEGVSDFRQLDFLTSRACDAAQGHYFHEALPLEALQTLLSAPPVRHRVNSPARV